MNAHSSRLHAPLTCPVCKREEDFAPPNHLETEGGDQSGYSHNARVVFASFHCPICLEDKAGPPMVVLSCGHAICQNDFKRLGGCIAIPSNPAATVSNPPRLDEDEESYIDADDYVDFGSEDEYEDEMARALMYAYANRINGIQNSLPSGFHLSAQSMPFFFDEDDFHDRAYVFGNQTIRSLHVGDASSLVLRRNTPKHGVWMLVPRGSNRQKLSLEHYDITGTSDTMEDFALGSRFISTSHGSVFVHAPPQSHRRRSPMWDVFYVKRGNCPVKKYSVPKDAKIISDCHGGIWSLTPISGNLQQMELMHYNSRAPRGRTVGSPVPSDSQIFMDKGGGVLLLHPDAPHDERSRRAPFLIDHLRHVSVERNQTASLWHITTRRRSLVLQGIPRTSRVVGDSSGESVFILSASGVNQSNLTRVWERGLMCSYDLDVSTTCIQDIADCGQRRTEVFIHCKCNGMWHLCKVIEQGEIEEIYPCPKNTRILSDRENGVWLWRRTQTSPERSLLNVTANGDVIYELAGFPSASSIAGLTGRRR